MAVAREMDGCIPLGANVMLWGVCWSATMQSLMLKTGVFRMRTGSTAGENTVDVLHVLLVLDRSTPYPPMTGPCRTLLLLVSLAAGGDGPESRFIRPIIASSRQPDKLGEFTSLVYISHSELRRSCSFCIAVRIKHSNQTSSSCVVCSLSQPRMNMVRAYSFPRISRSSASVASRARICQARPETRMRHTDLPSRPQPRRRTAG